MPEIGVLFRSISFSGRNWNYFFLQDSGIFYYFYPNYENCAVIYLPNGCMITKKGEKIYEKKIYVQENTTGKLIIR